VVAVGAIDSGFQIGDFSNQGPELDFVAPGIDVLSTLPVGSGIFFSGVRSGADTYTGQALAGSKSGTITGEFMYVGLGKREEIPPTVAGRIALIKRGEIRFTEKTRNAKEAGAIAVVVFNNDDPWANWTLLPDDDEGAKLYDWPVTVGLTKSDGEALLARTGSTITVAVEADDYGTKDGTSMASPHVAGAAGLLWSIAPQASAAEILSAMTSTARDLGAPGPDLVYGTGAINAHDAAKQLAPSAFPSSRRTTGRRFLRRGKG